MRNMNELESNSMKELFSQTDTPEFASIQTVKERDEWIEELWNRLEDAPMNLETEELEEGFLHFPKGTRKEDIWHWFDERHSKGVYFLLYHQEESNLKKFIKEEIPFRITDIIGVEKVPQWLEDAIVTEVYEHSDCMFAYDSLDDKIEGMLNAYGFFKGGKDNESSESE